MNRDEFKTDPTPNPIANASLWSRLSFWYLRDLFGKGFQRDLDENDIYNVLQEHEGERISIKFTSLWEEELKRRKPNIFRVYLRAYGYMFLFWGLLFSLTETAIRIAQPLFLGALLTYFSTEHNGMDKYDAYIYAGGIILGALLPVITFHPFILYVVETAMKLRIGSSRLLYKKTLSFSKSAMVDGINGRLINLFSNDLGKFDIAMCFVHDLWKGPAEAILLGYFIYREIGVAGIIGMAFLLSFIPLQAWVGKRSATYRLRVTKRTDIRVRFMNEIIQGIQVLKMYTWENSFAKMIEKIRKKEINALRGIAYIRATLISFSMISRISIFLSLISYVFMGNLITARKVYILSSFYNILNDSMVHFWPLAITTCAEGYVSAKRVQEYLLLSNKKPKRIESPTPIEEDEIDDDDYVVDVKMNGQNGHAITQNGHQKINTKDHEDKKQKIKKSRAAEAAEDEVAVLLPKIINNTTTAQKSLYLENVTADWVLFSGEVNVGVKDINLEVTEGKLCVVIGQVGSGKSTLLQVILGELELDEGTIEVNGVLSYAAQESWLFEGSIKNNIVFVEEFDEQRYKEVTRVCALERDFELFPHGDETLVGERGISLSGGQKARVSLARAVYKKADIYLMDDPLSAVDSHVGKHIFNQCITGFLRDKVCVLVTHQLQYLNNVEHIVLMNAGAIEAQGSYLTVTNTSKDTISSLAMEDSQNDPKAEEGKLIAPINDAKRPEKQIKEKEFQSTGSVTMDVYKSYFKAVQSCPWIFSVFLLCVLAQAALAAVDYFIAEWVNWEQQLNSSSTESFRDYSTPEEVNETITEANATDWSIDQIPEERMFYIYTYAILMGLFMFFIFTRTFSFFHICLRVSKNLHDQLFRGVTRATMQFFNNNPSGRILNRFSKDIGAVDSFLPYALIECVVFFLDIIGIVLIVAIVNYWLLVPTIFIGIIMFILRVVFIRTSRSLKRIESLSRSPMFSHTNATLQGLSTIRAFKAEKALERDFNHHQNVNSSAWYATLTTNRAFAYWLDMVCVIYIGIVTMSFLYFSDDDMLGGSVGLAITKVMALVGMVQWAMRQTAELENQMVSVERVLEYAELPSEPALETEPKNRPQKDWPSEGALKFLNVELRYSEKSGAILKDLNFEVKPHEKIGIVGRTGAGKSSIIQALFRLAPIEGTIEIDGINTNTLGLKDLRSKISIIPQDPILFSGTMRKNLDPFEEKTDDELWDALDQVELKNTVASLAGGLECHMSDGGSNFSMGQRQLVCLARAILRNNKILILDEATANVDPETDKLIQTTIRKKFSSCTVLTIAHRLDTVMDSDRVLVMDGGRAVEFAQPYELLSRPSGHLRKSVDETGLASAALLTEIAKRNYRKKKDDEHT